MRYYPENNEYGEIDKLKLMQPEDWMVEMLKKNPDYCNWGPHEDYMISGGQWSHPYIYDSWSDFGPWKLDHLNEIVNFYFEINTVYDIQLLDENDQEVDPLDPEAYLSLVLWVIHPRKGCSQGIEITIIKKEEMSDVYTYLRSAAERNANRFSKL